MHLYLYWMKRNCEYGFEGFGQNDINIFFDDYRCNCIMMQVTFFMNLLNKYYNVYTN